jgi:hypothetical protein
LVLILIVLDLVSILINSASKGCCGLQKALSYQDQRRLFLQGYLL